MATIQPKTDDKIIHRVEDANPSTSQCVEDLKIKCDKHGLTIKFPRGDLVVVDYARGIFKVMKFNDSTETVPSEQFNIYN